MLVLINNKPQMVDKHAYYIENRDKILQQVKWQYHKTKNDLEEENRMLYKRIANLKSIIEWKEKYIEDLRKYIDEIK